MGELSKLKGLGEKTEKYLNEIGIFTASELEEFGAVSAFLKLKKEGNSKPSLNFLYAMIGALENEHWINIAKKERGRLLLELDGYRELEEILKAEGLELDI